MYRQLVKGFGATSSPTTDQPVGDQWLPRLSQLPLGVPRLVPSIRARFFSRFLAARAAMAAVGTGFAIRALASAVFRSAARPLRPTFIRRPIA